MDHDLGRSQGAPAMVRRTLLVLGLLLCFGAGSALALNNGTEGVTVGNRIVDVTFNTPNNPDKPQWAEARRLINHAPAGSTIRMGIYRLTSESVYNSIANAVNRGVNVYVVANGLHHEDPAADSYLDNLDALLGNRFRWCDADKTASNPNDACISNDSGGVMHAKYIMLSKTEGRAGNPREDVVWVSSANFSGSGIDLYNNSVTVYDDPALYNGFLSDVWQPMWNDPGFTDNDYYNVTLNRGYFESNASNSTVYVSPEQTTDLWKNRLDYVEPTDGCRIRVMQGFFTDSRFAVADKLRALAVAGCKIFVLVSDDAGKLGTDVKTELTHPNIELRRGAVHDKTLMIRARYAGSTTRRAIVFVGSHNLSGPALVENDELILKLADSQALYNVYLDHFDHAWMSDTTGGGSSSRTDPEEVLP